MAEAASASSRSSDEETGMIALKAAKSHVDVEQQAVAEAHLMNRAVRNFSFKGVTVTVKDRETKKEKNIVDGVEGFVEAGELLLIFCLNLEKIGCTTIGMNEKGLTIVKQARF
jgi:hypothetical protein